MIFASKNKDEIAVKLLIELGAKVDITDSEGKSALMYATKNGCQHIVKVLLDAGKAILSAKKIKSD